MRSFLNRDLASCNERNIENASAQNDQPQGYHFHVYFHNETRDSPCALCLAEASPIPWEVGQFHPGPIGPHPTRQFQIRIQPEYFEETIAWLESIEVSLMCFIIQVDDDYWSFWKVRNGWAVVTHFAWSVLGARVECRALG